MYALRHQNDLACWSRTTPMRKKETMTWRTTSRTIMGVWSSGLPEGGVPRWKGGGLVRRRGLEPLCLAALAPQASASANFATSATSQSHELRERISHPSASIASHPVQLEAWASEDAEQIVNRVDPQEILTGGRLHERFVLQHPGVGMRHEDGVQPCGERRVTTRSHV